NLMAISGEAAEECLPPYNISASNIAMTSADISWESVSDISQWTVEYGQAGFELGQGTLIDPVENTPEVTLSNLNAGNAYDVYVKSNCAEGESSFEGPFTFATTLCEPSEQCDYTFVLSSTFGDGWNGNTMDVLQNGIVVKILELVGSSSKEVSVPICDGENFELYWNPGGQYSFAVQVEILDPTGISIFSMPPETGAPDSSLFTSAGDCPEPPYNDNLSFVLPVEIDAGCPGYDNIMASNEPGEPSGSCFEPEGEPGKSVWYKFEAPENGALELTTDLDGTTLDTQ